MLDWLGDGRVVLLVLILLAFAGRTYIDSRIRRGVEARFRREAQEFEHGLRLVAERQRFDYQRQIADFSILVGARHRKYARLWQLGRRAHGRVLDLGRFREQDFGYFDSADVTAFMERKEIPRGRRSEVVGLWDSDRSLAVQILNETLWSHARHDAVKHWMRFNNFLVQNELYFSDQVVHVAQELVSRLDRLRYGLEDEEERSSTETDLERSEVYSRFGDLRGLLRAELTRGDYSASELPGTE